MYDSWCACDTTGPLLREGRVPVAVAADVNADDVLEDPGLLIEGFFDEERVVGDFPGTVAACLRRSRLRQRRAGHRRQEDERAGHDQQLRGGARPDRDALVVLAAHAHAVGRGVAILDLDRFARLEVVLLDEAQEHLVLVDHARDGHRRSQWTRQEALGFLRFDAPL